MLQFDFILILQGVQFIVDESGGFSGVAAEFLENIADDYTNTPVLLYSVRDPNSYMHAMSQKESISRSLHDAISFSRLSSYCKLMVPVGLPSLSRSMHACAQYSFPYYFDAYVVNKSIQLQYH